MLEVIRESLGVPLELVGSSFLVHLDFVGGNWRLLGMVGVHLELVGSSFLVHLEFIGGSLEVIGE